MPDTIRTPQLAQVLQKAIQQAIGEIYVSLPAEVQSYDSAAQTVSVQPQLRRDTTDADGNTISVLLPVLVHVPVLFPGGSGFRIMWPLGLGDTVTLLMSDRSMDIWQSFGGNVDPLDVRMHSINDAVAIPGLHPDNKPWNPDNDAVLTLGQDGAPGAFVGRIGDAVTITVSAADITALGLSNGAGPVSGTGGTLTGTITGGSATVKVLG